MKVLIVGDYPPPYGGSSVQVSVLHKLLSTMPGSACRVLDVGTTRRRRRSECLPARNSAEFAWRLFGHASRNYLLHLHTNGHNIKSWLVTLACATAGLMNGRRTVVSLGSGLAPDFIEASGGAARLIVRTALQLIGAVICRNERAAASVARLGIDEAKVAIVSGFYGVRTFGSPMIPATIDEFLRRRSPVLAAIASSGPEYGIPLVLEAARRLRSQYPDLGVLLVGPERFEDQALDGWILPAGELAHDVVLSILPKVTVFVRPTYFDGDASSVREGLALGLPVVASDTDFRPDGTILFRRGDVADLTDKIAIAVRIDRTADPHFQRAVSSSFERLLAIYARLGHVPRVERGLA